MQVGMVQAHSMELLIKYVIPNLSDAMAEAVV